MSLRYFLPERYNRAVYGAISFEYFEYILRKKQQEFV